jgi:hypothetical protein
VSKKTLTRPLTVLVVGCIDDISKSVGKLFENPRYADDRNDNPDTTGLDLIVVITKAVSHKLIEHWHAYGRNHDILVINGDSKSTIIERLNEMATILEPQKKPEPTLNSVSVPWDPKQALVSKSAPDPSPLTAPPAAAGSSIMSFMAEVQGLQKAKDAAEAMALKEMERADDLLQELERVKAQAPNEDVIQKRIDEAVEKRATGLAVERTRSLEAELKRDRRTLEAKIKEVGRAEKKCEQTMESLVTADAHNTQLEKKIADLKLDKEKWTITPRKIRALAGLHMATAALLIGPDSTVEQFERFIHNLEDSPNVSKLMDEVMVNVHGKLPSAESIAATLTALRGDEPAN